MNFLFRSFILFGAALVLLLFVALLAPLWIDWEQFTGEFEEQASRFIGQPVKVGGDSNLRLLPLPYISFKELEVGANSDGSPLMTIEQFSLNAELLPFLSGEVRIVEMFMLKPRINLQVDEDGTVAWTQPIETLVDPEQVNIEKLTVQSGSLALSGVAGKRTITLENFSADLSARSVLGPWRLEGSGTIDGVPSSLKLSTGTYQREAGSIRLKVDVSREDQPYRLLADGPVTLKDDVLSWVGGFDLLPILQPAASSPTSAPQVASLALPLVVDGKFKLTPKHLEVPEYRLEVGDQNDPYVVTGRGEAEISERIYFKVNADGRQIDLDRIEANTISGTVPGLETRLAALRSVLNRIPVPAADGEIDVVLPAMIAGDTYIRDVKAVVSPFARGWNVRAFTATFPGNTTLEAKGRVGLRNDFGFAGRLIVASRQPSGFAAWMSGDVSPQIRNIKTIGLDSQVTLSENQVTLDQMELRLDDAVLNGKLQRIAGGARKPAIIAELSGNRVNTDDLQALYSLVRGDGDDLVSHDLNIKIKADELQTRVLNIPVDAKLMDAHIQVRDGSVSVEQFSSQDVFGTRVTSGGRIEDLLNKPNGNMTFTISAGNSSRLLEFVNKVIGGNPILAPFLANTSLASDTELQVEIDTSGQEIGAKGQVLLDGVIGGTEIAGRVGFNGDLTDFAALPLDASVRVSNDDPSLLLRQAGLETLPAELSSSVQGPLKGEFAFTGKPAEGMNAQILMSSPGASMSGQGMLTSRDLRSVDLDLEVTLAAEDIVSYTTLTGFQMPVQNDISLPLTAQFQLGKKSGAYTLDGITGQIRNNAFNGAIELETESVVRPRMSGDLNFDKLDLLLLAEPSLGRFNPLAIAADILPDEDLGFSSPLYPRFDAQYTLTGDQVSVGEVLSGANGRLSFSMVDGAVSLDDIEFDTFGGKVTAAAVFRNSEGTVVANGNFFVSDVDASKFLSSLGLEQTADGKLGITGSVESAGRSLSGLVAGLTGSGFARLEDANFFNLDPSSLGDILTIADAEGFEIDSDRIVNLVDETVLTSNLPLPSLDAPFSVSQGQIIFRNVIHSQKAADFSGDLEVELLSAELEAELDIRFKPDKRDAISGATPEVSVRWNGPIGAMERMIDASQLEGYLALRAFEASQRRIETLEARVIEKQRLTRQISYSNLRKEYVARKAEEERLRLLELERKREEAARQLEEKRRLQQAAEKAAAEERQRQAEEAARQAAEAALPQPSIESSPLEPIGSTEPENVSPKLRDNIMRNLENFLQVE